MCVCRISGLATICLGDPISDCPCRQYGFIFTQTISASFGGPIITISIPILSTACPIPGRLPWDASWSFKTEEYEQRKTRTDNLLLIYNCSSHCGLQQIGFFREEAGYKVGSPYNLE